MLLPLPLVLLTMIQSGNPPVTFPSGGAGRCAVLSPATRSSRPMSRVELTPCRCRCGWFVVCCLRVLCPDAAVEAGVSPEPGTISLGTGLKILRLEK